MSSGSKREGSKDMELRHDELRNQPGASWETASDLPAPAPVTVPLLGISFSVEDYSRSQLAKEGDLEQYLPNVDQQSLDRSQASIGSRPLEATSMSSPHRGRSAMDGERHVSFSPEGGTGGGGVLETSTTSFADEAQAEINGEVCPEEAQNTDPQSAQESPVLSHRSSHVPQDYDFRDQDLSLSGSVKLEQLQKDFFKKTITLATTPDTASGEAQKISTISTIDASGLISLSKLAEKIEEELEYASGRFTSLDLARNDLGEHGLRALHPLLQHLSKLVSLGVADNVSVESYIAGITQGQPSGLGFFSSLRAWMVPPPSSCLTELNLRGNWMRSEGAAELAPVLKANSLLTSLDVSSNNMFCAGAAAVAEALALHCTHLTALHLGTNWIADDGLRSLAPALVANSSLTDLSIPQNGIGVEGARVLAPVLSDNLPSLQRLDLLDNLMDAKANKILFSAVQLATTITTLQGLDPGCVGIFFDYVLRKRVQLDLQPTAIVKLDLSEASLTEFPPVLLELTCLESLDLSHNDLESMPYIELCGVRTLVELSCAGNPKLLCPPRETMEAGGAACMEYLRDAMNQGAFNIAVLLIPIGDTESGKSSLLRALASDKNVSSREYVATVSPELGLWTPAGQENKLNMKVVDLSGRPIYSITHEFFFSRAAVYLFVWRVLEKERFENEGGQLMLEDMVARWISAVQHTVPKARVFVVATHVDSLDPQEVKAQCHIVKNAILGVLARLPQGESEEDAISLVNGGEAFLVSSVRGIGISQLRDQIILAAKDLPQYGLPLTENFRAFNDALDVERHRNKSVWTDWKSFREISKQCGLHSQEEFRDVVTLMNDLYFIRYAANVSYALAASDEELQADLLMNTVYLDVEWCACVFKGLIRHERHVLLTYFGGRVPGMVTDDKIVDVMAKRFYVHGILHSSLMKYLWPFQGGSKTYWKVVMDGTLGKRETEIIPTTVANSQDDYIAIQDVLTNFGVMGAINADEFVVPFVRTAVKDGAIDSRTLDLSDCPFRCMRVYTTCPEHFLRRLATRLMQKSEHSELSSTVSVHFTKGNKLHLAYAHNVAQDSILTIRASCRALFDEAIHQVARMESWYPGLVLKSVDSTDPEDLEYLTMLQPVHVFISHSTVCAEDARGMATVLHEHSSTFDVMLSEDFRGKKGSVPECRVAVVLVDQGYARSKRCVQELDSLVRSGCHIVPILMPDFQFDDDGQGKIDYVRWWPASLPGMAGYDLFLDFRLRAEMEILNDAQEELERLQAEGAPRNSIESCKEKLRSVQQDLSHKYKKKLETELVEIIVTTLNRWRCKASPQKTPNSAESESPHATIPCSRCVSLWLPEVHYFERSAVTAAWADWKDQEKVRRAGEGKSFSEPFVTCPNGHGHRSTSLLADALGFEALLCYGCKIAGEPCPHVFPVRQCIDPFRIRPPALAVEEPPKAQRLDCPVCSERNQEPTTIPLVDIVQPEVFISFQWGDIGSLPQEQELKANAKRLAQAITWHAGVMCWLDCKGPPEVDVAVSAEDDEDEPEPKAAADEEAEETGAAKEHWMQTLAAIRNCKTFVVIMTDAYCSSHRTRREFSHAVQTRKCIIPVLMPPAQGGAGAEDATKEAPPADQVREASTGWTGGSGRDTWWHHAVQLSRAQAGAAKNMATTWTILKLFPPVSMLGYEDDGSDKDVVYRVLDRLNTGEEIQHDLKRLYRNWQSSRSILMAEIVRFADPEAEKKLTREEQLQARATRLFKEMDSNDNGIIDAPELKLALSNLGIHVNASQLKVMMAEADIDGDHGIDLQEFLDVVLGSELANSHI